MRAKLPSGTRVKSKPENPKHKTSKPSQNQPQPAKKSHSRIPLPQYERIIGRHIAGDSIRKISRDEKRDRETVTRIVRSESVQSYIQELRESYIGLGPMAFNAVRNALRSDKYGRLGHEILGNIGVIPSPRERDALISGHSRSGNQTPDLSKALAEPGAEGR
jgi:hypothetical protein